MIAQQLLRKAEMLHNVNGYEWSFKELLPFKAFNLSQGTFFYTDYTRNTYKDIMILDRLYDVECDVKTS